MNRADALKAVDDGIADCVKDLVNVCRKNAIAVGLDEAVAEFERGFDNLRKFEDRAVTVVEKAFAE